MTQPHNYISPLPPQKEQALYRWYSYSVYLILACIIMLALINIYQYMVVQNMRYAYQNVHASLQELQQKNQSHDSLQEHYKTLQARIEKMEKINNHSHNPITSLQQVAQHIPDNVCLTEFTCAKNNSISFQGYAPTAQAAISFLASLQQAPGEVQNVRINSLAPMRYNDSNTTWYQFHAK